MIFDCIDCCVRSASWKSICTYRRHYRKTFNAKVAFKSHSIKWIFAKSQFLSSFDFVPCRNRERRWSVNGTENLFIYFHLCNDRINRFGHKIQPNRWEKKWAREKRMRDLNCVRCVFMSHGLLRYFEVAVFSHRQNNKKHVDERVVDIRRHFKHENYVQFIWSSQIDTSE